MLDSLSSKCVGFVIMPDHVHVLLWLPQPDELSRMLHGWERMSSFRIRRWYADHAPNYFSEFGAGDRFWQPESFTFNIYSDRKLKEKLDYMHQNPVRAELVESADDWPWSSAHWYLHGQSVGVPFTWIECG